ncbi:MAG: exodeoxyribonuclease V subunit alpha [Sedimenticola sp.]|nr:exodeoxyribonuclease V subunit alpha [Sedimenticola sp.]
MSTVDELLDRLYAQGLFSDLDIHFAHLMGRLSGKSGPEIQLAAALTSRASSQGHVCLPLSDVSEQQLADTSSEGMISLPSLSDWRKKLRQSVVIGEPGQRVPLILDQADRLYLYRYWDYEQKLAAGLLELASSALTAVDNAPLNELLLQLFPAREDVAVNWQKVAAVVTLMKRLTIISGGPGTGKTSVVVRILALLQQQAADKPLGIALAAPTGKAAARLQSAIAAAIGELDLGADLITSIPDRAMTLHRLMGSRRDSIYFRHDHSNPLPYDVLIIDEASMIDVALMAKVVDALPSHGRLILLGDKNQLASVESGSVLGDICSEGSGFTAAFSKQLADVTGEKIPEQMVSEKQLADSIIELTHSYRFDHRSGIGQLADRVNSGDADGALSLLANDTFDDIHLLSSDEDPVDLAIAGYGVYLKLLKRRAPLKDIFKAFDDFRVLCALREGEQGVSGLNDSIFKGLVRTGLVSGAGLWFAGRPLLITQNDHNLKLYNGDIGIVLNNEVGEKMAYFETADGYRAVSPARLSSHETAFAMTVHKSQGSEFNRVLLVLPERENPLLGRELIYTGLTRSRKMLALCDSGRVLGVAIRQQIRRSSGLKALLWEGDK